MQDITGIGVDFNSMKSSGVFLWRTTYTLENGANYPKLQALRQCGEVSVLDLSGVVMQRLRYGALKADASGPEFSRQFVPAGDGTATGDGRDGDTSEPFRMPPTSRPRIVATSGSKAPDGVAGRRRKAAMCCSLRLSVMYGRTAARRTMPMGR